MPSIRRLDRSVINQIAAGEVIIQPCSVVKELVENSLDAGATRIEVEFTGGGADLVRVADNGCGMDAPDLALCLEPHTTSKIQGAEDLWRVTSCGFRGEALASIAEVSRLEITSRTREGAARRVARQGDGFRVEDASRAPGTTVAMRDLFHNVPVRRRFLKSERAETGAILDVCRRLAMSRPWVGLRLVHDGKAVLDLPEDQDLRGRVTSLGVFDGEFRLLDLDSDHGGLKCSGLLVAPPGHFGTSQHLFLFVNRRPFRDRPLAQALARACSDLIPGKRFPGGAVFLDMPPEDVDVNIHPTKSEVRFRLPDRVFSGVYAAARERLVRDQDGRLARPAAPPPAPPAAEEDGIPAAGAETAVRTLLPGYATRPWTLPRAREGGSAPVPAPGPAAPPRREPGPVPSREPAGGAIFRPAPPAAPAPAPHVPLEHGRAFQVLDSYLVVDAGDGVLLVDQHALHERLVYNRLQEQGGGGDGPSQLLLAPLRLSLPEEAGEPTPDILALFTRAGYRLSPAGADLLVEGIPDFLSPETALAALEEQLADLAAHGGAGTEDARSSFLKRLACHGAVRAGDPLAPSVLRELAQHALDNPQSACPHGRRAVWRLSREELGKRFGR